ncbi:FMN-dependent NADH-azoreductase [Corallincola holothuriorum]|uniref:FMN dependent NADH:quinone oxidoreductase n=1 Tax=Corallincola holothuriorum TaxID=2282215 RepID=A0A368NJH5_9GAMM|nr:FMN-dependent NADH-azoreductase [Corallincola holothuriorum]RCU50296.1 FMN-dependent NADH-azoreductase [Corallincola holothuriorum]
MKKLLVLNNSILAEQSQSSQLTHHYVEKWLAAHADGVVISRDLGLEPIPHLDGKMLSAWSTPVEERSPEQRQLALISDQLIEELMAADEVVVGMPMYNFGVPSGFKAWIDHIARAGVTFRYTESGPEGLLNNTKVIVAATRGGLYAGTEKDTQTRYLTDVFAFLGLTDVAFVYAEGLAMGADGAAEAMTKAKNALVGLAQR